MIGYSKKNIENYPRECFWWKETACEQTLCLGKGWKNREVYRLEKKKKPGLKFNPELALTGVRTTEPSRTFTDNHSLRSRRLEVVGERENGRARGRHERGVVSCRVVRVSFALPFFSCAQAMTTTSLQRKLFLHQRWPLWRASNEFTNSKNPTKLKIRKLPTGWFIY